MLIELFKYLWTFGKNAAENQLQADALEAAWASAYAAWAAVVASLFGLIGLWFTWRETRRTTTSALDAADEARKANAIAHLSTRPWLGVSNLRPDAIDDDKVRLSCSIENHGNTPAVMATMVLGQHIVPSNGSTELALECVNLALADFLRNLHLSRDAQVGSTIFPQQKVERSLRLTMPEDQADVEPVLWAIAVGVFYAYGSEEAWTVETHFIATQGDGLEFCLDQPTNTVMIRNWVKGNQAT